MKSRLLVAVLSVVMSSGCAGVAPSQIGQTAGTIAGAAIAPGVGAPLGALVGLVAGMLVQGQVDKGTEKRERKELSEQLSVAPPSLPESSTLPQGEPTRVWVDETVQGGRLIAGHFEVRYFH